MYRSTCNCTLSAQAEELSVLVETTYASSEVDIVPTVLSTDRAGREYIKRLNEANSSSQAPEVIEETVTSAPVPTVQSPILQKNKKSSTSLR